MKIRMKRGPETNPPSEAGLTLVELLICVTIMSLLGFVVANRLVKSAATRSSSRRCALGPEIPRPASRGA